MASEVARAKSLIKQATGINVPGSMTDKQVLDLWEKVKNMEEMQALATVSVALAAHRDAGGTDQEHGAKDGGENGDADSMGEGEGQEQGDGDPQESPGMDGDGPEGPSEEMEQQVQEAIGKLPTQAHPLMDLLVRIVLAALPERRNTALLGGPAGSGKSTAARILAQILGLPFSTFACNPRTTLAGLVGRVDAHGNYHATPFREMWENGGVICLDEIDNTAPDFLAGMNNLIDTPIGVEGNFPDGDIPRHKDFVVVCTANTWGTGRDRMYVGRQQLDAATLDRFTMIEWDYDENLEDSLGTVPEWTKYVQQVRQVARDHGFRRVVSPRATIRGGNMLLAGIPWDVVADTALQLTSWTDDEREKIVPVRERFEAAARKWGAQDA